ncbi:hypothetical protein lerEdw1_017332 [Lerista edwardsae]|nr:hypothetical protein lerEdw1_017332 [Lerista edwardsae]
MAAAWDAEQPRLAQPGGDSVESMRRIFVSRPEGAREGRPDGPPGGAPCPASPGEAGAVGGAPAPGARPPKPAPRRDAQRLALHYVVPCLRAYGLCLVDRFLGPRAAERVLHEVLALHRSGQFRDGALASQGPGGGSSKAIRGDQILWVEGTEPGCEHIGDFLRRLDRLVLHADGRLGRHNIRGRHKLPVETPGARSAHSPPPPPLPLVDIGSPPGSVVAANMRGENSSMAEATPPSRGASGRAGAGRGPLAGSAPGQPRCARAGRMPLGRVLRLDLERLALDYVAPCLRDLGFCYLDNFLGELLGGCVLERVRQMHQQGELQDGQLAGQRQGIAKRHLRGDQIKWVAGTEEGCEAIHFLLSLIDRLVLYCGSRLGTYYVKERSKVRAEVESSPANAGRGKLVL